jgi:hexosaminidase
MKLNFFKNSFKPQLLVLLIVFINLGTNVFAQKQKTAGLIPLPNSVQYLTGEFLLNQETKLVLNDTAYLKEANFFNSVINKYYQFTLPTVTAVPNSGNYIVFNYSALEKAETYSLNITAQKIEIFYGDAAGLFYGLNTLSQLLPIQNSVAVSIPCLAIKDAPRYQWRGMHLDCSRHFFTKDEVKTYIDYLAMYKLNVFHWHLTDDQGWRIEIKQYPLLTKIGSQRKESIVGKPKFDKNWKPTKDNTYDGKPHGGFYTQEEIKEVIRYAESKHITIVPEIEMPGHALAALASYPQYSCTGGPFETYTTWGVSDDVYCAGNDSTFIFIQNILTEVIDLFPGKYIHIGGDECPKARWQVCNKCQKRKQDENLKDENELQSYFITRVEKFVNQKGKQVIGWDEILEGGLAPNAAVMSWRGTQGGIDAAKLNHYVVMSPGKPCYFDHYQAKDRTSEPIAIGGFNPLDSVYKYNPTPASLNSTEATFIMGAQGNVWTEYITDFSKIQYMAMPRMAALSEVLWTNPENKNFDNFKVRLKTHQLLLDKLKINYAKHFLK